MQRRFRDRDPALGRRGPTRDPKHRILIVCEGKKTEPHYFQLFQHWVRNRLVHVEIKGEAGVPVTVVDRAIALRDAAKEDARAQRDDNLCFDEVWCVVDVDEHPNLEDACQCAKREGISVALSNPCFELWALLHFQDQSESIHRHDAQHALRQLMPGYEKELRFPKLVPGYDDAVRRARELDKTSACVGEAKRNPSTGVYLLTERIRIAGQR